MVAVMTGPGQRWLGCRSTERSGSEFKGHKWLPVSSHQVRMETVLDTIKPYQGPIRMTG